MHSIFPCNVNCMYNFALIELVHTLHNSNYNFNTHKWILEKHVFVAPRTIYKTYVVQ
jgi:hypothetical protein